ncbi:MAG: FAD-dependent monooxygenase [Balneolaceae bacterium]
MNPEKTTVLVIGGGAAGLYMALLLLKNGIDCRVIEQRKTIRPDSRSLGIHPVSLELFHRLDIAEPFIERGVKIEQGHAFHDHQKIGSISLHKTPKPFNYILSLPQAQTERLLEQQVQQISPDVICRGEEFTGFEVQDSGITVRTKREGSAFVRQADWLVGCDGKWSQVREHAVIAFSGGRYDDTYMMSDLPDHSTLGSDAAIWLHREGLIESFPIPRGLRRWVAKTDRYIENPQMEELISMVRRRTGIKLAENPSFGVSSFGVQHFLADTLVSGPVLLAGDSAHVVSPIGGQGMNLGWLTSDAIGRALASVIHGRAQPDLLLKTSRRQRRMAKQVARRAEMNMRLGRRQRWPFLRKALLHIMLAPPLRTLLPGLFTMRGLGRWPV